MTAIAKQGSAPRPKPGVTAYSTPNDRELVATRVYAAPRKLVWAAFHEPRHVAKWLLGPEGWTMPVCEIDLRVGGAWRYEWIKPGAQQFGFGGTFKEVRPPERVVFTERWGPEYPETVNTVEFVEEGGMTTVIMTISYPSKQAREQATSTGMTGGMDTSFARLDALLASLR